MINYKDVEADVKSLIGETYINDSNNPAALRDSINKAIERMSETIFRDNFIFTYTFTATGDRNYYDIPVQHSTKKVYAGDIEVIENIGWILGYQSIERPTVIAVYPDRIFLPDSTDTGTYTISYRGVPTLIASADPSTTQINLPRPYQRAIAPLAAYYAFKRVKQKEMAADMMADYKDEIASIAGAFMDPNENTPKRMSANHFF